MVDLSSKDAQPAAKSPEETSMIVLTMNDAAAADGRVGRAGQGRLIASHNALTSADDTRISRLPHGTGAESFSFMTLGLKAP